MTMTDKSHYEISPGVIENISAYKAFFAAMEEDNWRLGQPDLVGRRLWVHKNGRQVPHQEAWEHWRACGYSPPPF